MRGTIKVKGAWPVVSYDSAEVGILTSNPTPGAQEGPHVALYEIDTLLPISSSISFSDTDPFYSSFTDWGP